MVATQAPGLTCPAGSTGQLAAAQLTSWWVDCLAGFSPVRLAQPPAGQLKVCSAESLAELVATV